MTPQADLGIFAISVAAGLIGALAGVGGGILVIPALTFGFGVDIHLAAGASIVSVIATSSGAAAAYVRDRMTDMRVGMFLELATTTGAVCGALLAAVASPAFLYLLLGAVLLLSAASQAGRMGEEVPPEVTRRRWPLAFGWSRPTRTGSSAARSPTLPATSRSGSFSCGSPASSPVCLESAQES